MLRVFIGLLILFLYTPFVYSQQYWITQASPTTRNLKACVFTDSLKGWIAGDSGILIHTTNKGINWTIQNTGINDEIASMYFVNERLGFALAWEFDPNPPNHYGTRILSTTNGGNNWNNYLFPDTNLFLKTIYFLDSLNGHMGGDHGKILYTTNAGTEWIPAGIDSSAFFEFAVEKIKFYNSEIGFAVGGAFDIAGMVWKTTNGGRSWRTVVVGPEPIHDIHIFDSLNAIGVGGDFEFGSSNIITSNSGNSWTYTEFGVFGIANTIGYRTDMEAWISLGIVDSFLVTTNGGENWRLAPVPNGAGIYDLTFIDERNGWAVGNDGVILKYNSTLINIVDNNKNIPNSNKLHQNYPNPFNPKTIINYQCSIPTGRDKLFSYVQLKVYNVLGNEVVTLVNEKQNAGSYSVEFGGTNLSSGIYFYRLSIDGNTVDTKRMVLLK